MPSPKNRGSGTAAIPKRSNQVYNLSAISYATKHLSKPKRNKYFLAEHCRERWLQNILPSQIASGYDCKTKQV